MNPFYNITQLQYFMPRAWEYLKLMRFDRPIGFLLLLWPALWGLWLAASGLPPWRILIITLVGVVITRSLGCVINDIADRKFDPYVERTKARPLASGKVSLREALGLAVVLAGVAFLLVSMLNLLTVLLALIAAVLIAIYPFAKRFVQWPQFILGVVFGAFPVLITFSAVKNQLTIVAYLVALAGCFWTIAYDTMYAMSDKEDDLKIGVKSTAILFGRYGAHWVMVLQVTMLLLLSYVGIQLHLGPWYFPALAVVVVFFIYQQHLIKDNNRPLCFKAFLNNKWVGGVIFLGFLLSL